MKIVYSDDLISMKIVYSDDLKNGLDCIQMVKISLIVEWSVIKIVKWSIIQIVIWKADYFSPFPNGDRNSGQFVQFPNAQ